MSVFYPYDLACAACGCSFRVQLAAGIETARTPEARERILDSTFHAFACPSCGAGNAVEAPLVYIDFARGQYIGVEVAATAAWQDARLRHQAAFDECLVNAPSIARELGRGMERRLVFGLRALREKVLLRDAGLDDRVVEAVKGDLGRERGLGPEALLLRLSRVLPGGHLLFARFPAPPRASAADGADAAGDAGATADGPRRALLPAAIDWVTAPAERYQRRLGRRADMFSDYPWLDDDWLVDVHDGPSYLYR